MTKDYKTCIEVFPDWQGIVYGLLTTVYDNEMISQPGTPDTEGQGISKCVYIATCELYGDEFMDREALNDYQDDA